MTSTSRPSQPEPKTYIVLETGKLSGQRIEDEFNRLIARGYEVSHDLGSERGIFIFRYQPLPPSLEPETPIEELERLGDKILAWKARIGLDVILSRHVDYYLTKHGIKIQGNRDLHLIVSYMETKSKPEPSDK